MRIRKGGIFRTIDSKDFGIWQKLGFEKVIVEPVKETTVEPIIEEVPVAEVVEEPVTEEVKVEEAPVIDELPKSKKKKK